MKDLLSRAHEEIECLKCDLNKQKECEDCQDLLEQITQLKATYSDTEATQLQQIQNLNVQLDRHICEKELESDEVKTYKTRVQILEVQINAHLEQIRKLQDKQRAGCMKCVEYEASE